MIKIYATPYKFYAVQISELLTIYIRHERLTIIVLGLPCIFLISS